MIRNFKPMYFLFVLTLVACAFAFGHFPVDAQHLTIGAIALNTTAFPINPELTAIAIAFKNPEAQLIADLVLPRVPVAKKFTYTTYDESQGFTVPDTKVGRRSEPNVVDFGGTPVQGETLDWGLDDVIPNDEIEAWASMPKPASGGPISPQAFSTMMLTSLVELDREIRVANLVFNTTTYTAGNQTPLSGNSQWSDQVNSNPLTAITDAMDTPLVRPNVLVLGQRSWTVLRRHPKIAQAIGHSAQTAGYASRQQVADLLELDQIIVGQSRVNTAKRGQAPNYVRTWGNHAALLHVSPMAAQMGQPTFGWTAQWGTRIAGELPEMKAGLRGSMRVRSGESVLEIVVSQESGYLFQNVTA